uniref:Reverse transcriptase domain-containing protein n=1 Tax=Phytophthora ramorum TaxID=164328 RepID=H3HA67_PHYRM
MSRPALKDDKERYLTYSITVRAANKEQGIEEEVVTKKMPKFIDGGPKDFLEWVYHFNQLATLKSWNVEDKFLNTTILLEGDLHEAFVDASLTDDDTRMDEEFTRSLRKASIVVLPADYSEKIQEELWEIRKARSESFTEYSKRFRALVRMENTLARLNENSPMCEDALCRLYKRGLPYEWQNKYDASGQVYSTVAALVPFFERIEQGEQRLHRQDKKNNNHESSRGQGHRSSNNYRNRGGNNNSSRSRQPPNRGAHAGRGSNNANSKHTTSNKYCTFHRTTTHNTADCRALRHDNHQEEHQQADQRRGSRTGQPRQQRQQTRVEHRQQGAGSSSDEEYMFVGLNAPPTATTPPMRVMIKLESGKERYQVLLDSGCSRSVISSAFMQQLQQQGAQLKGSAVSFKLVKGNTKSEGSMMVRFRIPKLKRDSIIIHEFEVLASLPDHMTIGRDLMSALGLAIDFKNGRVTWDGSELTVRTTESGSAAQETAEDEVTLNASDEMYAGEDCAVTPEELLPEHLEAALQHCYLKLLQEYVDLYNGRLGRIRLDDYILPLRVDYTPSHAKPYSVPRSQEDAARREIQRLLELDVVDQIYGSEAAAPAFFLVKPNGSLRLLVDFRQLNRYLRRSPYYVPKIREILLRLGKAKCMTTLDANMGYFARRVALQSRAATAFCLPFGKFQFKRLPMGISTAPDEYQSCMERILGDLDFVIVYLDDILVFSQNPVEHLEHLRIVFDRLRQYDVALNGKKCHILRD